MTQWYEILGVIAVTFAGFSAVLVLAVYLERWLAQPDPPTPASANEQAVKPDRNRVERPAPDLSVQTGAPYVRPGLATGFGLGPPVARASEHLFTALPPTSANSDL